MGYIRCIRSRGCSRRRWCIGRRAAERCRALQSVAEQRAWGACVKRHAGPHLLEVHEAVAFRLACRALRVQVHLVRGKGGSTWLGVR